MNNTCPAPSLKSNKSPASKSLADASLELTPPKVPNQLDAFPPPDQDFPPTITDLPDAHQVQPPPAP